MIYSNDSPYIGAMIDNDREYGLDDYDIMDDVGYWARWNDAEDDAVNRYRGIEE